MKKFAVLKKVGTFGAEVEREFDDIDDALSFEVLMAKTEDNERVSYTTVANVSFWGSDHFKSPTPTLAGQLMAGK